MSQIQEAQQTKQDKYRKKKKKKPVPWHRKIDPKKQRLLKDSRKKRLTSNKN